MYKYDAFISYVHADNDDDSFSNFLNQLRDSKVKFWCDSERIFAGNKWKDQLRSAINNSLTFIPIITDNYCNKKWTEYEFITAQYFDLPIIPLIRKKCNNSSISNYIAREIDNIHCLDFLKNSFDKINKRIKYFKEKNNITKNILKIFEKRISFDRTIKPLIDRHDYQVSNYKKLDNIKGDIIITHSIHNKKKDDIIVKCYNSPLIDNELKLLKELIDSVNRKTSCKLRIYISKGFYEEILESELNKNSSKKYDIYNYFDSLNDFFCFDDYFNCLKEELPIIDLIKEDEINYNIFKKLNETNLDIISSWYKNSKKSVLFFLDCKTDFIETFTAYMITNFKNQPHKYPLIVYNKLEKNYNNSEFKEFIKNNLKIEDDFIKRFDDLSKIEHQMIYIFDCIKFSKDDSNLNELLHNLINTINANKIIITCKNDYNICNELNNKNLTQSEKLLSSNNIKCYKIDINN